MICPISQCLLSQTFAIRFENYEGNSYKFWSASTDGGGLVLIRFGRINSYVRELKKDLEYFEKNAPRKLRGGYVITNLELS